MSRLDDTIRGALELDPTIELETISYRGTPAWDSVAHMQLLTAIEQEYGLTLGSDDLLSMTDYAGVRDVVRRRTGDDRP